MLYISSTSARILEPIKEDRECKNIFFRWPLTQSRTSHFISDATSHTPIGGLLMAHATRANHGMTRRRASVRSCSEPNTG